MYGKGRDAAAKYGFGAVKFESFEEHLFAARLQSLPQRQAKDFRLSSAALGRLNIYLAFIAVEIKSNVA